MNKNLEHVLVIDDDADIRTICQIALEEIGNLRVTLCSSGEEGLERIKTITPDLILLDVMMPSLDGPGTLKALRETEAGKKIPVIFLTGKSLPQEVEALKALDAVSVFSKPFDAMTLQNDLQQIYTSLPHH